jgi:hypothetical protein
MQRILIVTLVIVSCLFSPSVKSADWDVSEPQAQARLNALPAGVELILGSDAAFSFRGDKDGTAQIAPMQQDGVEVENFVRIATRKKNRQQLGHPI